MATWRGSRRPAMYDPEHPTLGLPAWEHELLEAFVDNGPAAMKTLVDIGALSVMHADDYPNYYSHHEIDKVPFGRVVIPQLPDGEPGDGIEFTRRMEAAARERGVDIRTGHPGRGRADQRGRRGRRRRRRRRPAHPRAPRRRVLHRRLQPQRRAARPVPLRPARPRLLGADQPGRARRVCQAPRRAADPHERRVHVADPVRVGAARRPGDRGPLPDPGRQHDHRQQARPADRQREDLLQRPVDPAPDLRRRARGVRQPPVLRAVGRAHEHDLGRRPVRLRPCRGRRPVARRGGRRRSRRWRTR